LPLLLSAADVQVVAGALTVSAVLGPLAMFVRAPLALNNAIRIEVRRRKVKIDGDLSTIVRAVGVGGGLGRILASLCGDQKWTSVKHVVRLVSRTH
jgi:hypothetical protein